MTGQKRTRLKAAPSCQNCRVRKARCDQNTPCGQCSKHQVECIRASTDRRKERFSNDYVEKLHAKVKTLESALTKVRQIVGVEEMIPGDDLEKESATPDELQSPDIKHEESPVNSSRSEPRNERRYSYPTNFENLDKHKNLAVYGPTSVFDHQPIHKNPDSASSFQQDIRELNQNHEIVACIKLFFRWQYPSHNIFVFREAFVIDFFNPKPKSVYCSVELVYSICAMGATMSDDEHTYSKASEFYNKAKTQLLTKLDEPSITSMQTFLLLAFYDISNGNNSSGWMLSGSGIRMGFDLGFQLNPQTWFITANEKISSLNIAIRSRIFWGCYLADHFISLLLGRPSILKISDTSIPETKDLPDLEWIDEYSYQAPHGQQPKKIDTESIVFISLPLKNLINLINISADMLNDVFTRGQDDQFDLSSKFDKLNYYNSRILEWRANLPLDLRWDQQILRNSAEDPTLMNMRYYYYILLLCLNRPFIEISKQNIIHTSTMISPSTICNDVIHDLMIAIERFKSVHGLQKSSIFIVYCSILSVSVLILSNANHRNMHASFKHKLSFFMSILRGCFRTWKLAERSYKLIQAKLEKDRGIKLVVNEESGDDDEVIVDIPAPTDESRMNTPDVHDGHDHVDALLSDKQRHHHHDDDSHHEVVDFGFSDNSEFFGGPPVLMTSDLFDQDWASLFPDYSLAGHKDIR